LPPPRGAHNFCNAHTYTSKGRIPPPAPRSITRWFGYRLLKRSLAISYIALPDLKPYHVRQPKWAFFLNMRLWPKNDLLFRCIH
jgi:hypothetical protein